MGEQAWREVQGVAWLFLTLVSVSVAGFIALKALQHRHEARFVERCVGFQHRDKARPAGQHRHQPLDGVVQPLAGRRVEDLLLLRRGHLGVEQHRVHLLVAHDGRDQREEHRADDDQPAVRPATGREQQRLGGRVQQLRACGRAAFSSNRGGRFRPFLLELSANTGGRATPLDADAGEDLFVRSYARAPRLIARQNSRSVALTLGRAESV